MATDYDAIIRAAYKDPRTMGSMTKLQRTLKGQVPADAVRDFMQRQEYVQLRKAKPTVLNPFLPRKGRYAMDLAFMPWMGRERLVPLLNVVDVQTRKLHSHVLKDKTGAEVKAALQSIINAAGDVSDILADNGTEWLNKTTMGMLDSHGIHLQLVPAGEKTTMGIVERANRTLKALLSQYVAVVDPNWKPVLQDIVDNHNSNLNTSTHAAPDDSSDFNQCRDFVDKWIEGEPYRRLLNSFNEGDAVRVALKRQGFAKEGQRWSTQVYTVDSHTGYRVKVSDGTARVARDVQKVGGDVEESTPVKKAAATAEARQKKLKASRVMKETADYLGQPRAKAKALRSDTGPTELVKQQYSKKAPRAVKALGDYLGMPRAPGTG
jgi:hypothetical protein